MPRLYSVGLFLLLLMWAAGGAFAADDNTLALQLRAQTDFERVNLAAVPRLPDTIACVQSQAALVPVTPPAELSVIHYREGYCRLMEGLASGNRADLRQAARVFEKGVSEWPLRTPAPVSSALRVLADIAHLKADGNTDPRVARNLEEAVTQANCFGADMPATRCRDFVEVGRLWLGWIADRENRLEDAAANFQPFPNSGWPEWVAGRQALAARRFPEAVVRFQKAIQTWRAPELPGVALLAPQPDFAAAQYHLGAAQYLAGNYRDAVAGLDAALKLQPEDARALFLRGRAKEMQGLSGVPDYELASRMAFAHVNAPGAGGLAHLYRGIALYRNKDYVRAEQEFASALNFDPGPAKPDAQAWWHMAAVAAGTCGSEAQELGAALPRASDFFPKGEAENLLRSCSSGS